MYDMQHYHGMFSKLYVLLISLNKIFSQDTDYYNCPNWPRLLVLGAQKAGTTSFWIALDKHPDICGFAKLDDNEDIRFEKEVHFFDSPDRYEKGPEFYCSRFTTCKQHTKHKSNNEISPIIDNALYVDCTPGYLDFGVAQRMKQTFSRKDRKNIKSIAILREPIERLLSWYNHVRSLVPVKGYERCMKTNFCKYIFRESYKHHTIYSPVVSKRITIPQGDHLDKYLSFEEYALINEESLVRGQYVDILEEHFDVFGRENILVLNYDFMMNNQRETLSLVSKFVGIHDSWHANYTFPNRNDNTFYKKMHLEDIDCQFLQKLHNYYRPYNNKLYNMLFRFRKEFWSGQPHFPRFNTFSDSCTK